MNANAVDAVVGLDIEIPDGMELLTDRVGEEFTYADELRVGETVKFRYSGGSEDGPRTVLVVKVYDGSFEGLTLERDGGYRKYLDENVFGFNQFTIVEPFVKHTPAVSGERRVRFDEAGTALLASLTGEQLAELYDKHVAIEGIGTEFDAKTGEVVVKLPAPKVNKIEKVSCNSGSSHVIFRNTNDKQFALYLYGGDQGIGIHSDVTGYDNCQSSIENLRDELVKFLA